MWLQRILSVLLAVNVFAGLVCLALLFAMNTAVATNGEGTEFSEQEVTVGGAGVQLPGTILVPAGEDPVPGMCSCTEQDRILKHRFAHMLKLSPSWVSPP